jgi:hypothetical protein
VIDLLTDARVRVITFARHTTQIFQVLDVAFCGVLKRQPTGELPFKVEKETVKFIMKVSHDFKQKMLEPNRWEAFQASEFGLTRKLSHVDFYSMRKS